MDELPPQPGSYALILELTEPRVFEVGRLGRIGFSTGIYVYLGSARGPGGIRARLGRHLSGGGKTRWHIDYLRRETEIRGVGYSLATDANPSPRIGHPMAISQECEWSQTLAALPGASIPVPRFGASDCRFGCPAHLIHFGDMEMDEVMNLVGTLCLNFSVVSQ